MNTENTDRSVTWAVQWIAYDAECGACTKLARRLETVLRRRGVALVPRQTPWVLGHLGRISGEAVDEIKLLTMDGCVLGGAEALIELGRSVWMLRPFVWLSAVPGGRRFLKWGYRWIARHRRCGDGFCRAPQASAIGGGNPL